MSTLDSRAESGYVPLQTACLVLVCMAAVVLSALSSCSSAVFMARLITRKEGQQKIDEKREAIEKSKAHAPVHVPHSGPSPYVMTAEQKLKQSQQQQAMGPQLVETQAHDLAGVLSYLAANPVDDEDVEFRPPHRKVLLVPQGGK